MPISSSGRPRTNKSRCAAAHRAAPSRQRGVALILVLMLAVTASAFVVLTALNNRSSGETTQRVATAQILGEARRALIGYAVGYADGIHSLEKGPGRLPCPDLAGGSVQGVAESVGDCRAANDRETGLLPFRTLGLSPLTDGSGALLWYAVSDNFRSMTTSIVNSETPGSFAVDDTDDVVAVIIAPGPPLVGQGRSSMAAYSAAAWLEGDNATLGDNRFTRTIDAGNNDTVMIITRGDLMTEVAKVVNREVDHALANYRHDPDGDDDAAGVDPDCPPTQPACDDGMPWLAPRTASTDAGVVGEGRARLARLPLVRLNEDFDAGFTATWSLDGTGTVQFTGSEPPSELCLRQISCTQSFDDKPAIGAPTPTPVTFTSPIFGTATAPWSQGSCVLMRGNASPFTLRLSCTTSYSFTVPGRSLRRVYQVDVGGNTRFVPPTSSARRSVEVRAPSAWPAGILGRVAISDFEGSKLLGAARLEFTKFVSGNSCELFDVPFDLEVWTALTPVDRHLSPGALPPWLFYDKWLESVLVRYAPSEAPGYSGPSCKAAGTCFSLRMKHPGDVVATTVSDVPSIVVTPDIHEASERTH